jgi:hypothetical protein
VIQRTKVEIAGLIVGLGGGLALIIGLEQEELGLGSHVEGVVAHISGLLQYPLEHAAGIAHKGRTVRIVHVTDQTGHLTVAGTPGEDHKRVQIGIQVLVRFVDADETFNGGTVKHDLIVDSLLDLRSGDGNILELTENICELKPDELDVILFDHADNIFLRVRHCRKPLSHFQI